MDRASRLPKRIPPGSKYVLESHGGFVSRHLELPDGSKLQLATRKAATCVCVTTSIVPELDVRDVRTRARAMSGC